MKLKIENTGMSYWKLVRIDSERVEDALVVAVLSQMANDRWVLKDKHEKGKLSNQTFATPNQAKKWLIGNEGRW
jgi:hypothetical protein